MVAREPLFSPVPPAGSFANTSSPARFFVVVVGDLKKIDAGVRALNLGPARVLTVDDVFGPAPNVTM